MPLKRFTGATATEALSLARREAGKDALIVATRTITGPMGGSRGASRYEVLVSHETGADGESFASVATALPVVSATPVATRGSAPVTTAPGLSSEVARVHRMLRRRAASAREGLTHDAVSDDPATEAIYAQLRGTGLSAAMTGLIVSRVQPRLLATDAADGEFVRSMVIAALADLLASHSPDIAFGSGRRHLVVVGPPGAGKTTAVAKLGFHFALRRRRRVAIVSLDDSRAGASTRIATLAEAAEIPFRAATQAEDVAALIEEMGNHDIALVDTAGANTGFGGQSGGFTVPGSMLPADALSADAEVYLVLSGAMAPALARRVLDAYRGTGVTGVILTMLDASLPLGEIVESLLTAGLPVAFLCRGAEISDGVEVATAHRVAALVLQSARWDGNFPS